MMENIGTKIEASVYRDLKKTKVILASSENYYVARIREGGLPLLDYSPSRLIQTKATRGTLEDAVGDILSCVL